MDRSDQPDRPSRPRYAMVVLVGEPLASHPAARDRDHRPNLAGDAARRQASRLAGIRGEYRAWLARHASGAKVIREYDMLVHGVALDLGPHSVEEVADSPLVVSAEPSTLHRPTCRVRPGPRTRR